MYKPSYICVGSITLVYSLLGLLTLKDVKDLLKQHFDKMGASLVGPMESDWFGLAEKLGSWLEIVLLIIMLRIEDRQPKRNMTVILCMRLDRSPSYPVPIFEWFSKYISAFISTNISS